MNPTANKSDFEDLTTNLKDLAYSYLEKYSPSKQQLKVYLLKKYLTKIKGTKSKKEITSIIDKIISNLEKNRFLNDEMYSDSKARMFLRRGYSLNKINQSLRNKGIDDKFIKHRQTAARWRCRTSPKARPTIMPATACRLRSENCQARSLAGLSR